ncbi:Uncharacterised protein [Citrobacter amalonaticus]|nr:Uncharacterised protein [Citrobacter amalonaticus]
MTVATLGQAGHVQRIAKGLTHRGGGIDKDTGHACLFRQIGDQSRANHRVNAVCFQLVNLPARVFFGDIAALFQLQVEGFLKSHQRGECLLVDHHANGGGQFSGLCQRLQNVKPAGFDQDNWYRQATFQIRAVRSGGDDRITAFGGQLLTDIGDRFFKNRAGWG